MDKTISTTLDETGMEQFRLVKKSMGLEADANVLRTLISLHYNELMKPKNITVSKGFYEALDRKAMRKGKSVQQLIYDVVLEGELDKNE